MADTFKILGQAALAATTLTDVYTVPGATSTTISTISICNRSTATTFRISVAIAGAANTNAQYTHYDVPLPANDTLLITAGYTLATTDVLRVYAGSANVSVNVFGVEIS
jgi:hypothetical protein